MRGYPSGLPSPGRNEVHGRLRSGAVSGRPSTQAVAADLCVYRRSRSSQRSCACTFYLLAFRFTLSLPLSFYLLPLILPLTSYLLPLTSYLLPLTSYLLPLALTFSFTFTSPLPSKVDHGVQTSVPPVDIYIDMHASDRRSRCTRRHAYNTRPIYTLQARATRHIHIPPAKQTHITNNINNNQPSRIISTHHQYNVPRWYRAKWTWGHWGALAKSSRFPGLPRPVHFAPRSGQRRRASFRTGLTLYFLFLKADPRGACA